jgi:hypothetical protein
MRCNLRSLVLFLSTVVLLGCNPSPGGPPFAEDPEFLPLLATDPQGTPAPAGAPPLWTKVLKFRIPTGTVFDLSVDGWILREQNTAQCGDDGCYAVLARNNEEGGKTTWIVQAWPQVPARFANRVTYLIVDVSLNSTATGTQLASNFKNGQLVVQVPIDPVLGTPGPFATPGTPEWASANGAAFLAFPAIGESLPADADAYYRLVDPGGRRGTLAAWKDVNGFATDDSQDDAKAVYFNAGDLALGRSMHMKVKPNGDIAYYVSNYPTVEDALRKTNLIATVAMEYTLDEQTGQQRIMKFFVFGNDDKRDEFANLDNNGNKFVPNLCVICHGLNRYNGSADLGARFLPFDLSSFQYSASLGRDAQEADFKKLNQAILQSNASPAVSDLMAAWYAGGSPVVLDDAVPQNWGGPNNLYLDVIKPFCRSCHISRNAPLDFATLANFQARTPGFPFTGAQTRVCNNRNMPNAVVTYQRFWLMERQSSPHYPVTVLNGSPGRTWPPVPCPNPNPVPP